MKLAEELRNKMPTLSGEARLYQAAVDALRSHNPSATAMMCEVAAADRAMLAALVDHYLRIVRADMQRPALKTDGAAGQMIGVTRVKHAPAPSTSLPAEGQSTREAHLQLAQPRQSYDEGEGQDILDTQRRRAFPSSTQLHGEGQGQHEAQSWLARSMQPNDSSGGYHNVDTHNLRASAAVSIPTPKRDVSAMSAIQGIMAKSITFRLQDGRNIMDVPFHELVKIKRNGIKHATAFARESIVADYLLQHCAYANPDPHEKVGSYFPPKMIELAIAEADKKEAAHV